MVWAKLDTDTLTGTGDSLVNTYTAKTFNQFLLHTLQSGGLVEQLQFDNLGGTAYAYRKQANGAADTTNVSQATVQLNLHGGSLDAFGIGYFINIAGEEKLGIWFFVHQGAVGAGTAPNRDEICFKYAQTSTQVVETDVDNSSSGDFAISSNLTSLGTD